MIYFYNTCFSKNQRKINFARDNVNLHEVLTRKFSYKLFLTSLFTGGRKSLCYEIFSLFRLKMNEFNTNLEN